MTASAPGDRLMIQGHPADPIFIHGILPRSGTNFLWDLLLLHPDCGRAREPVNEDLFLDASDHLVRFIATVRSSWDPRWGTFAADLPDELSKSVGEGLVSFLWTDRERRLLTKSPSVAHLDRFFAFFPWARLLILVRDGRSVVQSAMDTFRWEFDRAARGWSDAARTIHRFQECETARGDRWRIVRYEDLVDDTEGQLRSIFEFLGLDAARYDFQAAWNLPVRGSSAFGRRDGQVHWEKVSRDATFAPKERWRAWSTDQVQRFDWIAGDQLARFGYVAERSRISTYDRLRHTVRDWRWFTATSARRMVYRARVRLALRTRIAQVLRPAARSSPRS